MHYQYVYAVAPIWYIERPLCPCCSFGWWCNVERRNRTHNEKKMPTQMRRYANTHDVCVCGVRCAME